jgi:hypothetical protein
MIGGMVVLAAAGTAAAIKLSKQDAQKIEEHTGLPPDQLEDQDLNQAMTELNITPQPLTPEDEAALAQRGGVPAGAPTPAPSGTPVAPVSSPAAGAGQPAYLEELQQLAALHEQGILSDEEFDAKKKQLLGI